MFENRCREWFETNGPVAVTRPVAAFAPCPCSIMSGFTPAQRAFIGEVYRLAWEMTEAQLKKPAAPLAPAFSLN